jgi:hypothetical protein
MVSKGILHEDGSIPEFEECIAWLVGLPEKTKGNWK